MNTTPNRVGLIIPTLTNGDAVGNDALGMAEILRQRGDTVTFFVTTTTLDEEDTQDIDDIGEIMNRPDDVLIYHHSIGFDRGVKAIERLPAKRKAVKYHNVTPPEFFKGVNSEVQRACAAGIAELPRLAKTSAHIWTDSVYNGEHLQKLAPGRAYTELPPFHQADELLTVEPDYRVVSGLDDWGTNILFVGRVAPNKNVPLAAQAFASYSERFDKRARLIIVGDMPVPKHAEAVKDQMLALGIADRVFITGKVSTAQLKALYLTSDVLLMTSLHEGFCVPLIEAMGLRVPVVAVPNAAIPYTGGDAVRYAGADAVELANTIDAVLTDEAAREQAMNVGRDRYLTRFTNAAIREKFERLYTELVGV
jgi:glycosyltransferase involved in cell wall biosynthesis